ncbi:major facilitator superfamily domain-containing protein [Linnemannia elongata]|nr:major facilitator superfamily domain-containing protein [Linnemannia elongata]
MIAPLPQSDERQPLLSSTTAATATTEAGLKRSVWYRARRSPFAVACVVAMALFTDMVVYGVVVPILPDIVKSRLGGTPREVGLLFACYAIGLLASTPVFAIMSDKYQNRRIPMMLGMLGLAVATVGFSLASNYWVLILARIGQGSAGGASWTIGLGLLADVYPPDNLGVVMGATMTANAVGFMLGPMVGGYLYEYHGYSAPFIFCAGLAVLDFMCIVFIAEPEKKKVAAVQVDQDEGAASTAIEQEVDCLTVHEPSTTTVVAVERAAAAISNPQHAQEILDDGLHHQDHVEKNSTQHQTGGSSGTSSNYGATSSSASSSLSAANDEPSKEMAGIDVSMFEIASNWTITCCLLATFVAASVFSGLEPILPLYLEELLGAGPTQTGLIFLAAIFPTLFSSAIGYYADKVGHFYISLLGMAIFAVATFSLSMPKTFLSFILPLALFGLGSSTILTPLLPAMADVVNKKGWNGYAKTYALYNMTYSLSMAVGPILAGFIFEDFGFWWTMVMFGIMIVVATPIIFTAQIAQVFAQWRGASRTSDAINA